MSIKRTRLQFEKAYTQIPNAWMRDVRVTRKARGLLAELMTHRHGWHISLPSLIAAGSEGRDSIRAAINELEEAGYLLRIQDRSDGKFGETNYILCNPTGETAVSDDEEETPDQTADGFTGDGSTDDGYAVAGKTAPKEDQVKEHQSTEHQEHLYVDGVADDGAEVDRADVAHLCTLLADLIERNGSRRPTVTIRWRASARLLLDRDAIDLTEAERVLRWCQADSFWQSNILSMPKFREKFDQLRLNASRGAAPPRRLTNTEQALADYNAEYGAPDGRTTVTRAIDPGLVDRQPRG